MAKDIVKDQYREKLGNLIYSFNEPVIKDFNVHMTDFINLVIGSAEVQSTINGILNEYVAENIITEDKKVLAKILFEGGVKVGTNIAVLHALSNQDLFAQKALNKAFNRINEILVKRQKPINIVD